LLEKEYTKNIKEILSNLSWNTTVDYDYLEKQTEKIFSRLAKYDRGKKRVHIDFGGLRRQHVAVQRMLIRMGLQQVKGDTRRFTLIHNTEIEDLIRNRPKGACVHLPGGIGVRKEKDELVLYVRHR